MPNPSACGPVSWPMAKRRRGCSTSPSVPPTSRAGAGVSAPPPRSPPGAVDKMSEDSEPAPPDVAAVGDGGFAGPGGETHSRRYRPIGAAAGPLPTLIYYHGGGFVIGNVETHDSTCRRLANGSRCQMISIDFRLAPPPP